MQNYLFLLWQDESKAPAPGTPEMEQQMAAYGAFYERASGGGAFKSGDPVQSSAVGQTVTVRGGATTSKPGPFSGSSEQIVGFYVLECENDEAAADWAAHIPAAATGAIEVRPIWSM